MTVDWSISAGVPPKFWLGDRVKPHPENARWLSVRQRESARALSGTIYGLEWHSEKFVFSKVGWYYWVGWDDWRYQSLHESELEALR